VHPFGREPAWCAWKGCPCRCKTGPSRNARARKLLKLGAASLSEAELLAILLPDRHTRELRTRHGPRPAERVPLLARPADGRAYTPCVGFAASGNAKYALLQASIELSRRHYAELMQMGPALANPRATASSCARRLRDRDHEVFCCLFLDNRHRVICFEEVFPRTIDGASVHSRARS